MASHKFIHDALTNVLDDIARLPPMERLVASLELIDAATEMGMRARDRYAYEARCEHRIPEIEVATGESDKRIYYWSKRWETYNGLPTPSVKAREDLTGAPSAFRQAVPQ